MMTYKQYQKNIQSTLRNLVRMKDKAMKTALATGPNAGPLVLVGQISAAEEVASLALVATSKEQLQKEVKVLIEEESEFLVKSKKEAMVGRYADRIERLIDFTVAQGALQQLRVEAQTLLKRVK